MEDKETTAFLIALNMILWTAHKCKEKRSPRTQIPTSGTESQAFEAASVSRKVTIRTQKT